MQPSSQRNGVPDLGPPRFARDMGAALCWRASAIIELVSRRMKRDGFCRTWEKVLPCGSLCESICWCRYHLENLAGPQWVAPGEAHGGWIAAPWVPEAFWWVFAIFSLIGFTLKCDSGRRPGQMLPSGRLTELTPRRCRMCLRGRDGSELACAIGKNGIHAVMRTARELTARVASDRVGRDTCSETLDTCSDARSVMQFPAA